MGKVLFCRVIISCQSFAEGHHRAICLQTYKSEVVRPLQIYLSEVASVHWPLQTSRSRVAFSEIPVRNSTSNDSLTPNDSVTITVTFDGQNSYATHSPRHSARQRSKVPPVNGHRVVRCEQTFTRLYRFHEKKIHIVSLKYRLYLFALKSVVGTCDIVTVT